MLWSPAFFDWRFLIPSVQKKLPNLLSQAGSFFSATAQVIPSGTDPLMLPGGPGQL